MDLCNDSYCLLNRIRKLEKAFCNSDEVLRSPIPLGGNAGNYKLGIDYTNKVFYFKNDSNLWEVFSFVSGGSAINEILYSNIDLSGVAGAYLLGVNYINGNLYYKNSLGNWEQFVFGGGNIIENLQETTDAGNTTTNSLLVQGDQLEISSSFLNSFAKIKTDQTKGGGFLNLRNISGDESELRVGLLSQPRIHELPDGTGTLVLTVNNIPADENGNIVINSSGVSSFLDLTDTPSSYTGFNGFVPIVNDTESGLDFIDILSMFDDYVPLAGTLFNRPIVGDLIFSRFPSISNPSLTGAMKIINTQGVGEDNWKIQIEKNTEGRIILNRGGLSTTLWNSIDYPIHPTVDGLYKASGIYFNNYRVNNALTALALINKVDYLLYQAPISSSGIDGAFDYSANYNALSYVQKGYVDSLIGGGGSSSVQKIEVVTGTQEAIDIGIIANATSIINNIFIGKVILSFVIGGIELPGIDPNDTDIIYYTHSGNTITFNNNGEIPINTVIKILYQ